MSPSKLKVYADYVPATKLGGVGELALQMANHALRNYTDVTLRSTGVADDGSCQETLDDAVLVTYSGRTPARGLFKGGVDLLRDCRDNENQIILHQSSMAWSLLIAKGVNVFCSWFRLKLPFPAAEITTTVFQTSHIHEFKNLAGYRLKDSVVRPTFRELVERWTLVPLHILLDIAAWVGSTEILVVSEDHKKHFSTTYGRLLPRRIRVVPNGFEKSFSGGLELRKPPEVDEPVQIIYLGVFRHRKRIPLLIEAVRTLNMDGLNIRLNIYGKPKKSKKYASLMRACDGLPFITFEGPVSRDEVVNVLRKADILCIPSSYEGLPVAMMEGLATGAIFVGGRAWGMRDVVSEIDQNLLFEIDNLESLKSALTYAVGLARTGKFRIPAEFWQTYEWGNVSKMMCEVSK